MFFETIETVSLGRLRNEDPMLRTKILLLVLVLVLELAACKGAERSKNNPSAANPGVSLAANPTSVTGGGASTLTWSSTLTDATCFASGAWSGAKATSGRLAIGSRLGTRPPARSETRRV